MKAIAIHLTSLLFLVAPLLAQDAGRLTVDQIWTPGEFRSESFGPAHWLEDGSAYTTVESAEKGKGQCIVQYDPESGQRKVLVTAARLKAMPVKGYSWSADGSKLLLFTNTRRVWWYHTRGDYWVLDLSDDKTAIRKLGGELESTWMQFAKFAPQGDRIAYVHKNNIYVESLADASIIQLTQDGSSTMVNGTFDWVYEEELDLRDGFRWSPDGKHIAYWQLDKSGVGQFLMIDNLSHIYAKVVPVEYPKVGTTNSSCRVGVVSAAGGETTWMQVEGDPRQNYIARMEWAANSDELVLQHLNRLQNRNRLLLAKAATGAVQCILTEEESAWLDPVDDLRWLDDGKEFTWVSERDGWRHLYRVSRDGSKMSPVSKGDSDLLEIQLIHEASGFAYAIASPDNPSQRFLYRLGLAGGEPERLTPADQGGWHGYELSPDGRWAIHTYSAFGQPRRVDLVSLPEHKVQRVLMDNQVLQERLAKISKGKAEFFRVDVGEGVALDGWCIKPPNFDASKRWPVIFHVYGEPAGQTVVDRWVGSNYLWHLLLAQQGYVVMSLDNRGTPAPRGREWRKSIYGKIGILNSQDQAAGLQAVQQRWDWVDPDRIGIWGWSGGGSMTLNMLFRHPELYHVGISVAPVPDEMLYDTIYQERYMGLPSTNAEGYKEGSPITHAHRLQGKLLLIHGTGDDNVHYQGAERLVDVLIRHDKQFSFMAYPNRSHSIRERPNTRRHLYKLMTSYFLDNLRPGAVASQDQ